MRLAKADLTRIDLDSAFDLFEGAVAPPAQCSKLGQLVVTIEETRRTLEKTD